MNLPICGYYAAIQEFATIYYLLVPTIIAVILFYIFSSYNDDLKPLPRYFYSFVWSIIISPILTIMLGSLIFLGQMTTINNDLYLDYNNKVNKLLINHNNYSKDQLQELNSWVECSISNGKISQYEYNSFVEIYEKFNNENKLKKSSQSLNEILKAQ